MVSTWRYYSFKGLSLRQPHTPLIVIVVGGLVYAIWNYGHVVLPMPWPPSMWAAASRFAWAASSGGMCCAAVR
jgi:hypothetical protein